jgi:hypothetical protein
MEPSVFLIGPSGASGRYIKLGNEAMSTFEKM